MDTNVVLLLSFIPSCTDISTFCCLGSKNLLFHLSTKSQSTINLNMKMQFCVFAIHFLSQLRTLSLIIKAIERNLLMDYCSEAVKQSEVQNIISCLTARWFWQCAGNAQRGCIAVASLFPIIVQNGLSGPPTASLASHRRHFISAKNLILSCVYVPVPQVPVLCHLFYKHSSGRIGQIGSHRSAVKSIKMVHHHQNALTHYCDWRHVSWRFPVYET